MEPLTFEQFENQVMAAFEDWPLRFKDLGDGDYSFCTVGGGLGYEGNYTNIGSRGEWVIYANGLGRRAKGNSLEEAISKLEKIGG